MYSGMTRLEQLLAYLNECGEPKTARQVAQYFKNNTKIFDYKTETQLQGEFNHEVTKDLLKPLTQKVFITTGYPRKISLVEYKNTQKVIEISEKDVIQFSFFNSLKALIGKYKNSILKYKGESIKISM
jgi:hypothetical protein